MDGPLTTLETELTLRRNDFAFLHAAFAHVGWQVIEEDVEGVTTDEGYDHELRARVRITVPLEAVAEAPAHEAITGDTIDRLMRGLKQVA